MGQKLITREMHDQIFYNKTYGWQPFIGNQQ